MWLCVFQSSFSTDHLESQFLVILESAVHRTAVNLPNVYIPRFESGLGFTSGMTTCCRLLTEKAAEESHEPPAVHE